MLKIILMSLLLISCANVKQINRGKFAKKIMQFNPNPHEKIFEDEVHAYREGAVGGGKAVGGGCGCN